MQKQTEQTIGDIMNELNKETEEHIELERMTTPDERLRSSLLNFVTKQINEIDKLDKVVELSLNSLKAKIELNELSASEILNVINTISNKKVDITTAILDPFKVTGNGTSPLLPPATQRSDSTDFERGVKEMSSEDLRIIEKVTKYIESQKNETNV